MTTSPAPEYVVVRMTRPQLLFLIGVVEGAAIVGKDAPMVSVILSALWEADDFPVIWPSTLVDGDGGEAFTPNAEAGMFAGIVGGDCKGFY